MNIVISAVNGGNSLMNNFYENDLAYIHDIGFGDFATRAAENLAKLFKAHHHESNTIIDLGCGSGIFAEYFSQQGYAVLGVDISAAMIEIAKKRAPLAKFQVASIYDLTLPASDIVTAISECVNYLSDSQDNYPRLTHLFQQIYQALKPKGLLIFDFLTPETLHPCYLGKNFVEGEDWIVLVEKHGDGGQQRLTRRIITFCGEGESYRRTEEIHHVQLYRPADIVRLLRQIGFKVKLMKGYGELRFDRGKRAILATKN